MGAGGKDASQIQKEVKEYYGETLATTSDLKTNACCTAHAPPKAIRDILAKVPPEVIAKYYGCGSRPAAGHRRVARSRPGLRFRKRLLCRF